jgi:hypothetical protein
MRKTKLYLHDLFTLSFLVQTYITSLNLYSVVDTKYPDNLSNTSH